MISNYKQGQNNDINKNSNQNNNNINNTKNNNNNGNSSLRECLLNFYWP